MWNLTNYYSTDCLQSSNYHVFICTFYILNYRIIQGYPYRLPEYYSSHSIITCFCSHTVYLEVGFNTHSLWHSNINSYSSLKGRCQLKVIMNDNNSVTFAWSELYKIHENWSCSWFVWCRFLTCDVKDLPKALFSLVVYIRVHDGLWLVPMDNSRVMIYI